MPDGVSEALKNFILQSNITQFEQQIQDRYDAYKSAIVANSFGIKCFTLSSPHYNSVMWSYYGDDYKGICREFPFQKSLMIYHLYDVFNMINIFMSI